MENALITGATKGIGRAIAIAFAKQGLNVAICSRNDKELQQFKQELQQSYPQCTIFSHVTNCSDKAELLDFARQAEQALGSIQVLVNNVGQFIPNSILEDKEDTLQQQLDTNLLSGYHLYRYFGPKMMQARWGHVFNICSAAATGPVVNAGSYSVTKAAQLSLNDIMRLEMQAYGIKVTAVLPGSTFTSSWEGTTVDQQRFVQPEDVASAIISCYLMSAGANPEQLIIKPVFGQL
ncbi:3-ketoacyl-ACP reductase [Mucilaginibacter koreensis]